MNQAQALYELQAVDLELNQLRLRLKEIEGLLGENESVNAAEATLAEAENSLAPWSQKSRDLELEVQSVSVKRTATETRLYSGVVSNPKELQDMQDEVASLKRRRESLEDDLLEAMLKVEACQEVVEAANQQLAETLGAWESDQGDLVRERMAANQRTEALKQERQAKVDKISEESMALYKAMFREKNGRVVALVEEGMCQVCGVGQSTTVLQLVRQGHTLEQCSNCRRILVIL